MNVMNAQNSLNIQVCFKEESDSDGFTSILEYRVERDGKERVFQQCSVRYSYCKE